MSRLPTAAAVWLMALSACAAGITPSEPPQTESDTTLGGAGVPDVDTSLHSVPLDQILFDTFGGGTVSLPESTPELRSRLLDAIPPIDDPVYAGVEGGDWLAPEDLVLGYLAGEQAYAYPFKILNFHEIVNDELDGVPVLISYCPLCRSGIVYDRRLKGETLEFSNTSALYESDLVMVDRGTGSYWWQVAGEAIVGPLTGTRLTPLPSSVARWDDWRQLHPDTQVLSRDTGVDRPYDSDPFAAYPELIDGGRFPFPVGEAAHDDRLAASTLVVGVEIGAINRVYPLPIPEGALNDVIDDTPIVVLTAGDGDTASVFSSVVDGTALRFEQVGGDYVDDVTASVWNASGEAISGSLEGERLTALPSRTTFWFAYIAAFPEAELHQP